jgi:hypothetical protein
MTGAVMEFRKYTPKKSLLIGLLFCTVACKNGADFSGITPKKKTEEKTPQAASAGHTESFTVGSDARPQVDVVFFIDTSLSMTEEVNAVIGGLQSFVDQLGVDDNGADYQVILVGEAKNLRASIKTQEKLDIRDVVVNSHSGLWTAYHMLQGHSDKVPNGKLALRPQANQEFVFLTDDDATGITSANFLPFLKENQSRFSHVHFNSVVGLPSSQVTSTCRIAAVGQSYIAMSNDQFFGGNIFDLCNANWTQLLSDLAWRVNSRAQTGANFVLSARPTNVQGIQVTLDGQPFSDFRYDQNGNQVIVNLSKVKPGKHAIVVNYQ